MLSSEGKSNDTGASGQQGLTTSTTNCGQERQHGQIFQLIDSLLSFEACLYHQILPFGLEDTKLLLGIVHPEDRVALDYVNRIVSYINCTMVAEEIDVDSHRTILSAYLNYKNTFSSDGKQVDPLDVDFTSQKSATTLTQSLISSATAAFKQNQPSKSVVAQTTQSTEKQAYLPPISDPDNNSPTLSFLYPVNDKKEEDSTIAALPRDLTILPVEVPELFSPIEVLVTLPPKKLLEELLARVLGGGIGRLYLERQPYQGRILWSDNGVLQSVLENLPLSLFQGVLNELKRFVGLPVTTLSEPKQVEKECLYQKDRLLLRLRVMPGMYGEEATLQVLRGAALKFYQQQQLARLSRDVLGISQQLSLKLHELHQRLMLNPSPPSEQLEALLSLNRLVENLDQQIKIISVSSETQTHKK
jgi:type II secretory ATPase GspE/PulE/Tfp pilus assembly ATPase PilB-like protein